MSWRDLSYLDNGTKKQRDMLKVLKDSRILDTLADFDPVVVSTICVGLDLEASDIDIVCQADEMGLLERKIRDLYGAAPGFEFFYRNPEKSELVCRFFSGSFEIEIFATGLYVESLNGYRHFTVMHRLVSLGGKEFQEAILQLKRGGLKTEPSIAKHLGLSGDPYEAVLLLEELPDSDLIWLLKSAQA